VTTREEWTVGQRVVIAGHRGTRYVGTVTKVGRKYITVEHGSGGTTQFHFDGRNTAGYANPHCYTIRQLAEIERRAAAEAALRAWGVTLGGYGAERKLTLAQIEALVAALPEVPDA
jgi:hypothetical protein